MTEQKAKLFDRFAEASAGFVSRAPFFVACVLLVLLWAPSFWLFPNVDTWQLVINTATTIVTFLMVFVIQATTNREMKATQIKLDELIRAVHGARNAIIATDLIPEAEVEKLQKEFEAVGMRAQIRSHQHAEAKGR